MLTTVVWFTMVVSIHGQDICSDVVQQAWSFVGDNCQNLGVNNACYGNIQIDAEPQPNVEGFTFDLPGDKTDFSNLRQIALSPLEQERWGIATFNLQANLSNLLPGQSVTMLMFGNTLLQNYLALEARSTVEVEIKSNPSYDSDTLGTIVAREALQVVGINQDGDWFFVQNDILGGWVEASSVRVRGDLDELQVMSPDMISGGMQAFLFTSGIGTTLCTDIISTGLIIQTNASEFRVDFAINNIRINLGSTAFIQNIPQNDGSYQMSVALLEGSAYLATATTNIFLEAGQQAQIELTNELIPNNTFVLADLPDNIETLPLDELPRNIISELETAQTTPPSVRLLPQNGEWNTTFLGGNTDVEIDGRTQSPDGGQYHTYFCIDNLFEGGFTFQADGNYFDVVVVDENTLSLVFSNSSQEFIRSAGDTFVASYPDGLSFVVSTITIENDTTINGIERRYKDNNCVLDIAFQSVIQ
jgi:hypothetical protein